MERQSLSSSRCVDWHQRDDASGSADNVPALLLHASSVPPGRLPQALVAYLHSIRADLLGGVLFRNPYIGYHHGMFDAVRRQLAGCTRVCHGRQSGVRNRCLASMNEPLNPPPPPPSLQATLLKKGVDNRTSLPGLPLPACELWESLAIAATVIRHVHTSTDKTMTVGHATFLAGSSQRWVRWDASTAEAAAALEAYQRAAGFDPLLTAAQLREVATLLAMQHSENCGNLLQQAEQAGVPYDLSHGNPGQQLWRPAAACCSCSLTALPHTCTMLCCLSR